MIVREVLFVVASASVVSEGTIVPTINKIGSIKCFDGFSIANVVGGVDVVASIYLIVTRSPFRTVRWIFFYIFLNKRPHFLLHFG